MADEPRRSGRAGKGQNAKLQDDEKPATAKGKKGKKNSKAVEVEEEEEAEDVIRCICGDQEAIPGIKPNPAMICCDNCNAWQHNLCMGLSEDDDEVPDKYYCEQCKPQDHPIIIAALKKGDKIWEERQRDFINAKKSGGKKKGRKSKGGRTSSAQEVAEPTPTAESETAPEPELSPAPMQPPPAPVTATVETPAQETPRPSAATSEEPSKKRRQSAAKITEESDQKRRKSSIAIPEPTGDLTADRQKLVTSLQNHFAPLIKERVNNGTFKLPGQSNVDGFSISISALIEQALNTHIGGAREKADKARTIMFNTKKNETLLLGLLNKTISAESLVNMSSEEMATQELQQERSVMKEEADKQAMLLHEEGPRIRKTHKGEEIIGGGDGQHDPTLNLTTNLPNRAPLGDDAVRSPSAMSPASATPGSAINGHATLDRKTSGNFDINNVWSQVKSPDTPQGPFVNNALRQKSISRAKVQQTPTQGPGEDADIDRLLDDENEWIDGSYVNDPDLQWSGSIYMKKAPGTLKSLGTAKHFGGFEMNTHTPWKKLLRTRLEISGRLLGGKADEYVIAHKKSQRKEVSVLQFTPSANHTPEALAAVASYFLENDRWGVINGNKDPNVQDLYFVPTKGLQGKPKFFEELGNIEYTPSEDFQYFLVAIVLVNNSPPPGFGEQTPIPQPQGTPQIPNDPSFSKHQNGHSISQVDGAGAGFASPTPYQQQPFTANADTGYHPSPLAIQILGPFINEPVAKQMVVLPNVTEQHLLNLRDAFEKDERCRADMAYLMQWLKARGAQQEQEGRDVGMTG